MWPVPARCSLLPYPFSQHFSPNFFSFLAAQTSFAPLNMFTFPGTPLPILQSWPSVTLLVELPVLPIVGLVLHHLWQEGYGGHRLGQGRAPGSCASLLPQWPITTWITRSTAASWSHHQGWSSPPHHGPPEPPSPPLTPLMKVLCTAYPMRVSTTLRKPRSSPVK